MNKTRRKLLAKVVAVMQKLEGMENNNRTLDLLKQAKDDLENATTEEQDVRNNLPENLTWSTRADILNDNLDNLYDALVDMAIIVEAYELNDEVSYRSIKKRVKSVIDNCTEAIERV